MGNYLLKKSLIVGIIILFTCSNFVSSISGYSEVTSQVNVAVEDSYKPKEKVVVSCHTYGLPIKLSSEIEIPYSEAEKLFEKINNLAVEIAKDSHFEENEQLYEEVITLAKTYNILSEDISAESLKTQFVSSLNTEKKESRIMPLSSNRGAALFCNFVTTGSGMQFPIIILPRLIPILLTPIPRAFLHWSADDGFTSCGSYLTRTGFMAGGMQRGTALGFWGVGFSVFIPPVMAYGFIGYALFVTCTAEAIEPWPPNNPPVISDIYPPNNGKNIPITLSELSFKITDADGENMDYIVETSPDIGSANGQKMKDGTYTVSVSGLEGSTEYTCRVKVTDGEDWTNKTFSFTTIPVAPFVLDPNPKDGSEIVPIAYSQLNFTLIDYQGDSMDYTVETHPFIGSDFAKGVGNGTYTVNISNLDYFTGYTWYVNVTDGIYLKHEKFSFRTLPKGLIILHPIDDAKIRQRSPDNNYGSSDHLDIRNEYGASSGWAEDSLIKFDISTIPSNITIYYAYLKLYYYKKVDNNPAGRDLNLYRVTSNWNENSVTWNTQPSYVSQPTTFATVPSTPGVWMKWNVTNDVLDFIDGSEVNCGWKLTDDNYWGKTDIPWTCFRSKEYGDYTPYLEVGVDD